MAYPSIEYGLQCVLARLSSNGVFSQPQCVTSTLDTKLSSPEQSSTARVALDALKVALARHGAKLALAMLSSGVNG